MSTIEAPRTQPVSTVPSSTAPSSTAASSTVPTRSASRAVREEVVEPLVLTPVDRLAMRLGTVLMTRAERRAAHAERTEQSRRSAAAQRSAATALDSFDRRSSGGPRWW